MNRRRGWYGVVALLAGLHLTGCAKVPNTEPVTEVGPAKVEHLEGADPARVTLTPEAMKRLDIQTGAIGELTIEGKVRQVIPYAAVLYDTDGDTWTYATSAAGVFVRSHVTIDRIVGNQAVLSAGPAVGTRVVIVGAAELYGSETEFEEE